MKNLLQKQLEELLERYSLLIKNFKIPESVLETLEKFKTDYYDNTDIFFDKIEEPEIEIFPVFSKIIRNNTHTKDLKFINSFDIDNFLSGDIIVKTFFDKAEANILRTAIASVLNSSYKPKHPKLLHLLIPDIVKTLFASNIIVETAMKFLDYRPISNIGAKIPISILYEQ